MKLAVVYLLPGDSESDGERTKLEVQEDFGDMNVLVAYEEATARARLRREFGPPVYDAIREADNFRDVDIWEIQGVVPAEPKPEGKLLTEVVTFGDGFRVMYRGGLCTPHFADKGGALAYIDILDRGQRKPEYVHTAESDEQRDDQN